MFSTGFFYGMIGVGNTGYGLEWFFLHGFILVCLALSFVFGVLWYSVGTRVKPVWAQKTAFECGFDPLSSSWAPFTLRFFLLALVFLVFDVEIVLFFSVVFSNGVYLGGLSYFINFLLVFFLVILFVGLLHEENEGSLDWN